MKNGPSRSSEIAIWPNEHLTNWCPTLVSMLMLMLTSDKNTATSFHCFKRTAAFRAQ